MIVGVSLLIFREEKEHWRLTAEQYRRAYLRSVEIIEEMKDETIESVKFNNSRLAKAFWAIKDDRFDMWPYSEAEWKWHKGE